MNIYIGMCCGYCLTQRRDRRCRLEIWNFNGSVLQTLQKSLFLKLLPFRSYISCIISYPMDDLYLLVKLFVMDILQILKNENKINV